jgi:hypothetical protein
MKANNNLKLPVSIFMLLISVQVMNTVKVIQLMHNVIVYL